METIWAKWDNHNRDYWHREGSVEKRRQWQANLLHLSVRVGACQANGAIALWPYLSWRFYKFMDKKPRLVSAVKPWPWVLQWWKQDRSHWDRQQLCRPPCHIFDRDGVTGLRRRGCAKQSKGIGMLCTGSKCCTFFCILNTHNFHLFTLTQN